MATWPSSNPSTTTTDADSDSISGARADINQAITNINSVVDMFDMSTLADDRILVYDAASATFKVEDNVSGFTGDMAGNVLYDSTGDLILEDTVEIRPNNTVARDIVLGDETFGPYNLTNIAINGADTHWSWITLDEHAGVSAKNGIGAPFPNPMIISRVQGGTPGSEVGVTNGRRLLAFQSIVGQDDDGSGTNYQLQLSAVFRFQAETTENHRNSGFGGRGTKILFDTTANGSQTTTRTIEMQGSTVEITPNGNGTLDCGGDLSIKANNGTDDVIITRPRVNVYSTTTTGGAVTPDYNDGEWQIWQATSGSSINFNLPSNLASGQEMRITVHNNSGGNFNLTVNSSYSANFSVLTISDTFRTAIAIENHGGVYYATTIIHNK